MPDLIGGHADTNHAEQEFSDGIYTETFTCQRKTIHSKLDFDLIWQRLISEVGDPSKSKQPQFVEQITGNDEDNFKRYTDNVRSAVKERGFMAFTAFNYSWIGVFPPHTELRMKKIIIGNPILAYAVLQHNRCAALSIPLEILLDEKPECDGGGCRLTWDLPSSGMCGTDSNKDLLRAAKVIDGKLEALLKEVSR
ncbi:hypothetical protein BP6252_06389 [Coleophoma cylindrospora]|uniref:DUF302 domain-containing protein n=1 Tax=Coleophoma cylindrospora TaxID=1849047 RepID=A0A3D8RMG2_9HELO|nr:hypothetical protein BP6252_06389 [Coleophoma cylindrospora]